MESLTVGERGSLREGEVGGSWKEWEGERAEEIRLGLYMLYILGHMPVYFYGLSEMTVKI